MQTFLPYYDFQLCAQVLDYRRLGKQRVEVYQILNTLLGVNKGWQHHPAVKMWAGYEKPLLDYGMAICYEWRDRGYKDTMLDKLQDIYHHLPVPTVSYRPLWLGNERLHLSHQSNLLRKDKEHYGKYFIGVPDNLPYYWPEGRLNVSI